MNPFKLAELLIKRAPHMAADPDGRDALRTAVGLFEGLLEVRKSPYGASPKLKAALTSLTQKVPEAVPTVEKHLDELKRLLSEYDDVDGVKTFP